MDIKRIIEKENRKYKGTKKAVIALFIVAVLLFCSIICLRNLSRRIIADERDRQDAEYAEMLQENEDKAQYRRELTAKAAELKEEEKHLKYYYKDLAKAYEKGEDIQPIIDEYEAVEEDSEDAE